MSKKPHLPDTPFDVSSPTLAVGELRTLSACVEPRCRVVRRVALVSAVCTCVGILSSLADVGPVPEHHTRIVDLLFILSLFTAPSLVVGLAASFCHSRSGSLLLCISLPMLFQTPLSFLYGVTLEQETAWTVCLAATMVSLAFTAVLLILYPLFLRGEHVFLNRLRRCPR